jgi:hypothetical protein
LPPAIGRPVSVIGRELHSKVVWFLSSCVAVNAPRNASSGLAAWTAGEKVRRRRNPSVFMGEGRVISFAEAVTGLRCRGRRRLH